jgi:hypothetical protein
MLLIMLSFIIYLATTKPHTLYTLFHLSLVAIRTLITILKKLYSLYQSATKEHL